MTAEDGFARRVTTLGALADPVRRALYRFVADQPGRGQPRPGGRRASRCRGTPRSSTSTGSSTRGCWSPSSAGSPGAPARVPGGRPSSTAGPPRGRRSASRTGATTSPAEVLADAVERSLDGTPMDEAVATRPPTRPPRWPSTPRRTGPAPSGRRARPGRRRPRAVRLRAAASTTTWSSPTARSTGSPPTTRPGLRHEPRLRRRGRRPARLRRRARRSSTRTRTLLRRVVRPTACRRTWRPSPPGGSRVLRDAGHPAVTPVRHSGPWVSRKTSCSARSRSATSGSCGCGSPTCSAS